jgi:ABC-type Fe3+/spermidine/putrescine transport system ATPase subunit
MAAVALRGVVKEFASLDVSFEVDEGELLVLLGPSGCGKTTTLRLIAGLEEPDAGEIWLDGRLVSSGEHTLPTEKRNVGMVFQSYAIWPHMTVFDNVAYPLRVRHVPNHVVRDKVEQTLALVGLAGHARRPATQLSGGQQQRVALARAIVFEPRLLLLDEPLSNLDARLRVHMRTELKHLQRQTGLTTVFVTHDQAESMVLADRIVVMNQGRIEQVGSPAEVYERPRSRFVSEFVGSINVLQGEVTRVAPDLVLRRGQREIRCRASGDLGLRPGQQVLVSIRPEKLFFPPDTIDSEFNVWEGRVASTAYYGDHREYEVQIDGNDLIKVTTPAAVSLAPGAPVCVACDPAEVVVMGGG